MCGGCEGSQTLSLDSTFPVALDASTQLLTDASDCAHLKRQANLMQEIHKRKRPEGVHDLDPQDQHTSRRRRNNAATADLCVTSIQLEQPPARHSPRHSISVPTPHERVASITRGMSLDSNPEQLRTFSLLSDYFLNNGGQLLMHLGGIGGTGKKPCHLGVSVF
jgi:hypothetical protein